LAAGEGIGDAVALVPGWVYQKRSIPVKKSRPSAFSIEAAWAGKMLSERSMG
jgi:hypothetical protein